jgi:hypothetical protein
MYCRAGEKSGVNGQARNRSAILNGLIAEMTAKNIIQAHKLNRSTVYAMKNRFEAFVAAGGSPDSFSRKNYKRRSDYKAAAIAEDVQRVYAQTIFIKKTWLSAFSYAESRISLVFCRSLGFIVLWFSSITAESHLVDLFVLCMEKKVGGLYLFVFA